MVKKYKNHKLNSISKVKDSFDLINQNSEALNEDLDYLFANIATEWTAYGPTSERPSNPTTGFYYFDTDLGRPIFWNGTTWITDYSSGTIGEWQLVWSDEFNGSTLDLTKWGYHPSGYSNNEQSYYSEENVSVENGKLILKAEMRSNPDNKPYVSGAIDSRGKFSQTYGRFEIRAKLPNGQGYWPAIWLLPEDKVIYGNWPASGEIDIMETGGDVENYVGTIHYSGLNSQHLMQSTQSVKLPAGAQTADFNVYAIEWEPTEMRWYCNDVLMGSASNWSTYGATGQTKIPYPAPFDKDFYLILNLAVGGTFIGNVLPEVGNQTAQMEIDYVRVYEKPEYIMPEPEVIVENPYSTYVVTGTNKIQNGAFVDANNNLWALDGSQGINAPTINNGELKVDITQDVSEQHLQSIKYTLPVSVLQNEVYRLSFKARSNKVIKHVRPVIDRPNAGWTKVFLYDSLNMDTNMQTYNIEFQSLVNDSNARLLFYMGLMGADIGGANHTIYFDDIELYKIVDPNAVVDPDPQPDPDPVDGGIGFDNSNPAYEITGSNLVQNGTFVDANNNLWVLDGSNGINPPIIENEELKVNILYDVWEQHLQSIKYTPTVAFEQGLYYRLKFKARSNKVIKHVRPAIDRPTAGWTTIMLQNSIDMDTTIKTYIIDFQSQVTDTNARLLFYMGLMGADVGGGEHTIYFDDIELYQIVDPNAPVDPDPVDLEPALATGYGVEWHQDVDDLFRVSTSAAYTRSNFDSISPWKDLRRCMLNDDGTVNYYIDPANPTLIGEVVNTAVYTTGGNALYDGSHGQVMVEIPKFWYKADNVGAKYRWYVGSTNISGYKVHPAFVREGVEIDKVYFSAFEGFFNAVTNKMESRADVVPSTNNGVSDGGLSPINAYGPVTDTIVGDIRNCRVHARARGTNWEMQDFLTSSALQLLFLIEYASFDSQTQIGTGIIGKISGANNNANKTGATIFLGNASGRQVGTENLCSVSYRGVENLWGNIWTYVDGLNLFDYRAYASDRAFESNKFNAPYADIGLVSSAGGTFIKDIVFSPDNDFSFLPGEGGGSSSSHLHDNWFIANGARIAKLGGSWYGSGNAGIFYWILDFMSDFAERNQGARLMYIDK
jgi:beta-glucanase (GH16 family)/ribosomal protein L31E